MVEGPLALARGMLASAGLSKNPADALEDGSAMDVRRRMTTLQGGDLRRAVLTARGPHMVTAHPLDGAYEIPEPGTPSLQPLIIDRIA